MLLRYWQAALIAAFMTLFGNVVWAQTTPNDGCTGFRPLIYRLGKCCEVKLSCSMDGCCKDGKCCKDGNCCKDANSCGAYESCCKSKTCSKQCTCCTEKKCDCTKGGECCCKEGECRCGKSCKCSGKDTPCHSKTACCPFMNNLAKKTAIIMVLPSPMPMFAPPPIEAMFGLPHPPPPVPTHVAFPTPLPPPPPMLTPPGLPVPTLSGPVMPPQTVALPAPTFGYYSCPTASTEPAGPTLSKANTSMETCLQLIGLASDICSFARTPSMPTLCESTIGLMTDLCPFMCSQTATPCAPPTPPCAMSCEQYVLTAPAPAACHSSCGSCGRAVVMAPERVQFASCTTCSATQTAKIHITAMQSSDELEMNVGGTCIRCKKMTVAIGGENEITLSRFDDRVRVRGEELKATAGSVRSECGNRLILEGDVELHYKKDGHSANVTGDRIELNLSSGAVTIKPAAKPATCPAVHIPPQ